MTTIPEWIAAIATVAGALMTAANLGTRITGWGFVAFAVGSVAWVTLGIQSDQVSLIVTDGVLLLVNLFGVWRWLGRQTRYEDSGARAAEQSRSASVPTLFPVGSLVGATVKGPGGESRGEVVEAMLEHDAKRLAYVVVSEGGVAGAGEVLRTVAPEHLRFQEDEVYCDLGDAEWNALPTAEHGRWPTTRPDAPT